MSIIAACRLMIVLVPGLCFVSPAWSQFIDSDVVPGRPVVEQFLAADEETEAEFGGTMMDRIEQLEQEQIELNNRLEQRDQWIESLLATEGSSQATDLDTCRSFCEHYFGKFQPGGAGFKLANTQYGDVNYSMWTYSRYLNQSGLDSSYTDSFGRTIAIDRRNDLEVNKVNMTFKGWIFDPNLNYAFFIWTANASQGDPAQVVVAGSFSYEAADWLNVGIGIDSLPSTRSTRSSHPNWLRVDYRTVADEFFRASFTTGIWAKGTLTERSRFRAMLGNNMSQLGVNASKLDNTLNTCSAAVWWMPTTGEYGPREGYGDYEWHEEAATILGLAFSFSTEDRQSQPNQEDLNNTQLRLSDGTVIFRPDAFGTRGQIERANYQMIAADSGIKYHGLSLDAEYFVRLLNNFQFTGDIPVTSLFDHGFQVQTSAMMVPKTLQTYVLGSKIFGEYGSPSEIGVGMNWFPTPTRQFRVNGEFTFVDRSPIGYSAMPIAVGSTGVIFNSNIELYF